MHRASLASLFLGLALALGSSPAFSQCSGQPPAGRLCANATASGGLPGWYTQSAVLDRNFGGPSVQGTMLNRGASLWSATATPTLGLNGTAGGSLTLAGSSTGSATIGVKAAAGSVTFNLPITNGTVNQVLITDGSGNTSWTTAGAGTVSSVGLALPSSILMVSGSPVTGTGTLTGTLATQSANLVWAGPATGSAATPTFRSLVGADLPNPSASSLGGIQSAAAVTHQWINSISTSGVPALSQPAFMDISGVITPAQCPNPSASTIGCIQSYAAVANQWINAISTAGVPSSTQPNFTNLAGNATLGQLPSISNNSILGNNSGGTSIPSALSASNVLDMINNVQGDILYRNAAGWVVLPPGTNGQILTTSGAAANPTWTTVTGTGTVTSVATGTGLAGGTITTTGTLTLASISAGTVLANVTGGSAIPIPNTPSSILDIIGSTTGDILYRSSGSGWQVLAPGTNGQVLTQGASTPSWSNAGSVSNVTISAGVGITPTGTCTITTTGTCTIGLSTARQTLPTVQVLATVGAAQTYTTPSNALWIEVSYCGSGGGGGGVTNGSPGSIVAGTAGGNTTFNAVVANGGAGAGAGSVLNQASAGGAGGTGGTGSATMRQPGGPGGGGGIAATAAFPSPGGSSMCGGGATISSGASFNGVSAANNSGGGGGGSFGGSADFNSAGGGGGGEYAYLIITSPAGTYTYTITAGGAGGVGSNFTGGAGGSGKIIVTEHYGS